MKHTSVPGKQLHGVLVDGNQLVGAVRSPGSGFLVKSRWTRNNMKTQFEDESLCRTADTSTALHCRVAPARFRGTCSKSTARCSNLRARNTFCSPREWRLHVVQRQQFFHSFCYKVQIFFQLTFFF